MSNNKPKQHTYIIVDPNEPETIVRILRQLLIGKLLSLPMDNGTASE